MDYIRICKKCKKYEAYNSTECKVCGFKKRRAEDVNKVLSKHYWDEDEIDYIIYNILYNKITCINELLPNLKNKSLDDLANLLSDDLKIRGQCIVKVKINCDVCGKEYLTVISKYKIKSHKYCSMECRNQGFNLFGSHKGENNSRYNSKEVLCTNCGKPMSLPKYKREHKNAYGDSHCFCCQECYWEYRGKYYVKEKSNNYHKEFSKEQRELMRQNMLKRLENGSIPQTKTKPHIKINEVLDNLGIKYSNEKNIKYYSLDIFLDDYNLAIEIMGDYWHGSPVKYSQNDLSDRQKKDIKQDKSKHTYVKKYYNLEILYLWEDDIKNNIDVCQNLIKKYIENKGILQNYNSYNYYNDNNNLYLKDEIINPYFIK